MARLGPRELVRFNAEPIASVDYVTDIAYASGGIREQRLDVITPHARADGPFPVYVYFHGGGWTSGDKSAVTKYCASQAQAGIVVVNVNYRMATSFSMSHMLHDANAALAWVRDNIAGYGGHPDRIVLGGDSAGGQIAALYSAAATHPALARHYDLKPAIATAALRGVVLHCSAVDFSVIFERGFILGLGFVRMLLPEALRRSTGHSLRSAARFLSPIEWVEPGHPPVLVTTSERDYFYRASLNYVQRLREKRVPVQTLIYDRSRRNTEHTWQQYWRFPESQEVYRALQRFVGEVTGSAARPVWR